jgi:hypothetical protein
MQIPVITARRGVLDTEAKSPEITPKIRDMETKARDFCAVLPIGNATAIQPPPRINPIKKFFHDHSLNLDLLAIRNRRNQEIMISDRAVTLVPDAGP